MADELIHTRREGNTLVLEMAATASRNALSRELLAALHAGISDPGEGVVAIVITGGPKIFSAGAHFKELTGTEFDVVYDAGVSAVTESIVESDRIVIAALEGACIGASADIALSCDFRVGTPACYFMVPAVRLGLLYNPSAIDRLGQTYPLGVLRRLLLLGERIGQEEALDLGLLSHAAEPGGAVQRAVQLVEAIGAGQLAALGATKQILRDPQRMTDHREHWEQRRRALLRSTARHEAVAQAKERHG